MRRLCRGKQIFLRISLIKVRFFNGARAGKGPYRNSYDYTDLLQLSKSIKRVQKLHSQIITGGYMQNPFVAAKLVGKYCESSCSENMGVATKVFNGISEKDVFLWNVVIQGYSRSGSDIEAVNMFDEMRLSGVCPNRYTYTFVLKACGALRDGKGEVIHGQILKTGLHTNSCVQNALLTFYAKCGEIDVSRKVFDEMPERDNVSWNSMISGYTSNGYVHEALKLFNSMLQEYNNGAPEHATLIAILPACAQAAAIQVGLWIHCYLTKRGMEIDAALGSCLITMYSSCGYVKVAKAVFDRVSGKNIIVWNAMIRSYGMNGYAEEALKMFSQFLQAGLQPDGIMFLCLLSTCSHAGLIAKGRELFKLMGSYAVEKGEEHYACMVDILGRAGHFDEALALIESMPVEPGVNVYGALLGASRKHNRVELAKAAAEKLFVLDPQNAGRYVIMAQLYKDAELWDDAARVRMLIRKRNIRKLAGYSSIEVGCVNHMFYAEDESHPFKNQIFDTLNRLDKLMEGELVEVIT